MIIEKLIVDNFLNRVPEDRWLMSVKSGLNLATTLQTKIKF